MKRLTDNYNDVNKDEVYTEIQARREDREGQENANLFDGITSSTPKEEMVAALEADDKGGATGTGRSSEGAGVGTAAAPETKPIPDSVKIKRTPVTEAGTEVTASPKVSGNQGKLIIDNMQSTPVEVFLFPVKPLHPDAPSKNLVFIQGAVSNDLLPEAQARTRFAVKKDGTVIYNSRGFDDVRATAEFDLVDIVKLIQHNHGELEEAKD
jgi:hypothetical protein